MLFTTQLSSNIVEMIEEFHSSHIGLDAVKTEEAALHDALHSYLGLGVSLEDEELVLNCTNLLSGLNCSAHLQDRCEFLISLLPVEVLIELSSLLTQYI